MIIRVLRYLHIALILISLLLRIQAHAIFARCGLMILGSNQVLLVELLERGAISRVATREIVLSLEAGVRGG